MPIAILFGASEAAAQTVPSEAVAYARPSARAAVGEVTFAVGPAVRVSVDGVTENVGRGTRISPGDRLDTAEGGLLHVRFIDGAMVSLRPGSRLLVQDYEYNAAQVGQSLIRFRLDHGVARAISGAAAEGAKERFRLNTPLVAIGVRGTDFVVRSDSSGTTASVNQGAIVMAPFGAGCQQQALGPCTSPTARLLAADMGQLLVEYQPRFTQPEIRPQQQAPAVNVAASGAPATIAQRSVAGGSAVGEEEVVAAAVVRDLVQGPKAVETGGPLRTPAVSTAPAPVPPLGSVSQPEIPPAEVVAPPPAQLAWGRWGHAVADDISLALNEARQGRRSTVGNSYHALYRAPNATGELPTGLGSYQFSLQQSQAQYVAGGQVQPAKVEDGRLAIDFAARRFSTSLNVSSAATGTVALTGTGTMRPDGIFVDRKVSGQAIAGAVAFDGKTAGYLFEKNVGAGQLSGITLWMRP